jgi:hypothetical protein
MSKIFWGVLTLGVLVAIVAGNNSTSGPGPNTAMTCKVGKPSPGHYYSKVDDAEFRTGPGSNYPMVVNARATQISGKTQYQTLATDVVLEGICATDDWLQGKIIEADGSPVDWETGWVPKRLMTTSMTADQAAGLWWVVDKFPDIGADPSSVPAWEKKIMHDGALMVLKDNKDCGAIYVGYPDARRRHAYYTVECTGHGGFKVKFTAKDVRTGKSFAPPEPFSQDVSNQMCQEAILRAATHPSTVNFHIFGLTEAVDPETGDRKILREFDAKNGFGLELNYAALCVVKPTGKIGVSIRETR